MQGIKSKERPYFCGMNSRKTFQIENLDTCKQQITNWLRKFDVSCILDSNTKLFPANDFSYSDYSLIIAAGVENDIVSSSEHSLNHLETSLNKNKDWLFGFFSYDLKNQVENLESNNTDNLWWPDFYLFSPQILLFISDNEVEIQTTLSVRESADFIWKEICSTTTLTGKINPEKGFNARISKKEYLENVEKLRTHILRGDIYEINYCQEFYTYSEFDPFSGYQQLSNISPTPFSCFLNLHKNYLLSASPERFLKKTGDTLISQPIKGTTKRGTTPEDDLALIEKLSNTTKERAENIMIVDLVRNDLSKVAQKGSVKVEELCGIYSFKQVHQMISTVTAQTNTNSIHKILKATFPMGSMTGAPKISAMKLAEKYETTKRGLYSGAVGYIAPNGDFDFNVVIRSLQYNSENNYLSYMVGGAITYLSDAEQEYDECILKAAAINKLFTQN